MVKEGEKRILKVFVDGKDVTSSAKFAINDISIAKVGSGNAIEGVKAGSTTVDVVYGGYTAQFTVYVVSKTNGSTTPGSDTSKETGIRLCPTKLTLLKGESNILSVLAELQNGNLKDVTSQTTMVAADGSILDVASNGIIKGLTTGETVIHTSYNGFTQDCYVKVIEKGQNSDQPSTGDDIKELILNYSNISLRPGDTQILTSNSTATTWSCSDNNITLSGMIGDYVAVKVSDNAPLNTTATITATVGSKKATCLVKIVKDTSTDDSIDPSQIIQKLSGVPSTITLEVGKTKIQKNVKVQPTSADSSLKVKNYSSSVATVSYDKDSKQLSVKAKRPGMAKVTLTTVAKGTDGNSIVKELTIKVTPKTVAQLKKSSIKSTSVKLSWKKQSYVTGYEIQYTTGGKTVKKKTGKNVSSFKLTKLKPNKKYKIKVRSYKKCGSKDAKYLYGPSSKSVTVTTKRK